MVIESYCRVFYAVMLCCSFALGWSPGRRVDAIQDGGDRDETGRLLKF